MTTIMNKQIIFNNSNNNMKSSSKENNISSKINTFRQNGIQLNNNRQNNQVINNINPINLGQNYITTGARVKTTKCSRN